MSYGVIYTIPFRSIDDKLYVINIEQEGFSGTATELKGADTPLTIYINEDDNYYAPIRNTSAQIRLMATDAQQGLYSARNQDHRISVTHDGAVVWCGYINPETYQQDYSAERFVLELDCVGVLDSLQNIDYKTETRAFISLLDLLKKCISAANPLYTAVYLPDSYKLDENGDILDMLQNIVVPEQNFFDEDDTPMRLSEVLEAICTTMQWTCTDWGGAIWFVDHDHDSYVKCDIDLNHQSGITANEAAVQDIGIAGSDHTLSTVPGFNKITVRTSNYPAGTAQWEIKTSELDKAYARGEVSGKTKRCKLVFYYPGESGLIAYAAVKTDGVWGVNEATEEDIDGSEYMLSILGAMPLKSCEWVYRTEEQSMKEYNYEDVIQIRFSDGNPGVSDSDKAAQKLALTDKPIIRITRPHMLYEDGAFALSGMAMICRDSNMVPVEEYVEATEKACGPIQVTLKVSFRIGDKYWSGRSWSATPATFSITFNNDDYKNNLSWNDIEVAGVSTPMPYSGLDGHVIPVSSTTRPSATRHLVGDLEILVYAEHKYTSKATLGGIRLKNFGLSFSKYEGDKTNEDTDCIYENVINADFINEAEEIELKISTYNADGPCYGKLISAEAYITNNIYSNIEDQYVRLEEHLIRRWVNRYNSAKIKLSEEVKYNAEIGRAHV